MEPHNLRFGGGLATSNVGALLIIGLVLIAALIVLLPRRLAIAPVFGSMILVPLGQVIVLGGVHFSVMRIAIIVAFARWFRLSGDGPDTPPLKFNAIDWLVTAFAFAHLIAFSLQWMSGGAVIEALGTLLDSLGAYLVLRSLIRTREDLWRTLQVLGVITMVLAACMVNEQLTHRNVFYLGSPDHGLVAVRGGKVRSQGPFEVYLTAGNFGATLLPLFAWWWKKAKSKAMVAASLAAAIILLITSNSSTPDLSGLAAIGALCLWPLRDRMYLFRRGIVAILVGLQLVMKAPVWALIGRVDLTGSSDSYHRFMLVDNFIRHFSDWWLIGYKNYNNWGWDMWDLSNQYVAFGLTGGLLTFALFIAILTRCFGRVGTERRKAERSRGDAWFYWCLGASLFSHVVAFFGMSYFDQESCQFFLLLAIISAFAYTRQQPVSRRRPAPPQREVPVPEPEVRVPEPVGRSLFYRARLLPNPQ